MLLKLYFSPSSWERCPPNRGFKAALELLDSLAERGIEVERVDTSGFSEEELWEAYSEAVRPAVFKKRGIRRVFGTRTRSGVFFGSEVPALLVYERRGEQAIDVYPHRKAGGRVIVTIGEFLSTLLKEES